MENIYASKVTIIMERRNYFTKNVYFLKKTNNTIVNFTSLCRANFLVHLSKSRFSC